jgi:hypothetical protein
MPLAKFFPGLRYDRVRTKDVKGGYERLFFKGKQVVAASIHKGGKVEDVKIKEGKVVARHVTKA